MDSNTNKAYNETISSIAFDPKSPSSLLYAEQSSSSSSSEEPSQFQFLSSDYGTGCNPEETQCLMRLIDVHNNSFSDSTSNTTTATATQNPNHINSQKLSQAYRKQIVDCIQQWQERIDEKVETIMKEEEETAAAQRQGQNQLQTEQESHEMKEIDDERGNKDLLKVTLAITHLAEIYLCNDKMNEYENDIALLGDDSIMHFDDDDEYENDDFHAKKKKNKHSNDMGIVTADTIRYLRYHHLNDIEEYAESLLNDEITIEELLQSTNQPEHWQPEESSSVTTTVNLTPYWALVRKLVQRGLLKDAWNVLQRHSACVRAQMKFSSNALEGNTGRSSFIDQTIREDMEAFMLIQKILLFAPLPGGRTELNDCCLGEDIPEYDDDDNGDENDQENWWNGMTLSAYKLWDTIDTTNGDNDPQNIVQDAPSEFNIYAAMNIFNSWKMSVTQALRTNVALRNLTRRIPSLQSCLWDVILSTQESFVDREDSWAERLVAELLYVRPNIRKDDVSIRAMVHMKQCGVLTNDDDLSNMDSIVLDVMRGNAGSVIEALHSLGGASGAALPATVMALLCCLLVNNGQIRLDDLSYDLRAENLLSASSAIISSFTRQNHNDIGIRLSTQLLQYYITPENMQVTGHVAATLASHFPKSDAEVRGILKMCVKAIERGSYRILDACESLCFARSQYYKRTQNYGSMVGWLLRGIECASRLAAEGRGDEDSNQTELTHSMTFRQLTRTCYDMASSLLVALCKKDSDEDVSQLLQTTAFCKDVQGVIMEDDLVELVSADPSVSLFIHVSNIGWGIIEKNDKQVVNSIINCLQERPDLNGSMITIAPPRLYGYFLTLAYDVLNEESGNLIGDTTESFDVQDIQVLFCCLEDYCNGHKYGHCNTSNIREDITLDKLRVAFGKGLMGAFVYQNTMLRGAKQQSRKEQQSDLPVNLEQLLGMSM